MKLSKENIINLEDFRSPNAKVYTGRDRGEKARKDSNIDKIEEMYSEVRIIIPNNIYSINPSFFEELFVNIVRKIGREKFMEKFKFISEGNYAYERPLNEAIVRILRNRSALG